MSVDHGDGHGHTHPRHNLSREESPTQTEGLQREYRVELERRFRALRGVLRQTIDGNDALRLREDRTNAEADRRNAAADIGARDRFPFRQRAAKEIAFQNQLREWLDTGVLEPVGEEAVEAGEHFTGTYVRASYREGLLSAEVKMRQAGAFIGDPDIQTTFNRPIHRDQLQDLYTRNFEALEDITEDLDRILSRELSRGLIGGENPRTIASRLTKETRTIQRTRARTLARTEILHSHNQATKNRFRDMNVGRVLILGSDPCPICEPYVGNEYPIDNIPNGGPPFHPNCVGSLAPVIG